MVTPSKASDLNQSEKVLGEVVTNFKSEPCGGFPEFCRIPTTVEADAQIDWASTEIEDIASLLQAVVEEDEPELLAAIRETGIAREKLADASKLLSPEHRSILKRWVIEANAFEKLSLYDVADRICDAIEESKPELLDIFFRKCDRVLLEDAAAQLSPDYKQTFQSFKEAWREKLLDESGELIQQMKRPIAYWREALYTLYGVRSRNLLTEVQLFDFVLRQRVEMKNLLTL